MSFKEFSEFENPESADYDINSSIKNVTVDDRSVYKTPSKEDTWIRANAYKYGFILRYPKDKVNITGYKYEPWHLRYFGIDLAKTLYENNLTYEEYLARL